MSSRRLKADGSPCRVFDDGGDWCFHSVVTNVKRKERGSLQDR